MALYKEEQIAEINKHLYDRTPGQIVKWALGLGKKAVITTNFGPYAGSILHLVTIIRKDIPVIWCDTGYNTPQTYRHADTLIQMLGLRIHTYVPRQTVAWRDVNMGGIPHIEDPLHKEFTRQVKIEPIQRAFKEHQPKIWFTNLRQGQTTFRDSLDVLSMTSDGILRVCPFYYTTDRELDRYLETHKIPDEPRYYDPTKVHANRECGLHY
jgi:phosphoadenosine phosphosulfate reductase